MSGAAIRAATLKDAERIYALVSLNSDMLVPRSLGNIVESIDRFVIAEAEGEMVGCASYQIHPEIGDAEAASFEARYLKRILEEQAANDDGSFFGSRLAEMRGSSWYYYTRLESDAFYAMTLAYWWHRHYAFPAPKAAEIPADGETWEEPCQRALFLKTPKSVRSVVFRAQGAVSQLDYAPNILCVPTDTSDLADWAGNLVGRVGVNRESDWWSGTPDTWPTNGLVRTFTEDAYGRGFRMDFSCDVNENAKMGEGEKLRNVAKRQMEVEAVSDGATMAIHERVTMETSETLPRGYRTLHLTIPNDVHNGHVRTFRGGSFAATYSKPSSADTGTSSDRIWSSRRTGRAIRWNIAF